MRLQLFSQNFTTIGCSFFLNSLAGFVQFMNNLFSFLIVTASVATDKRFFLSLLLVQWTVAMTCRVVSWCDWVVMRGPSEISMTFQFSIRGGSFIANVHSFRADRLMVLFGFGLGFFFKDQALFPSAHDWDSWNLKYSRAQYTQVFVFSWCLTTSFT